MAWEAAIAAGAALLGGAINSNQAGVASGKAADAAANQSALQSLFAQYGVTWKMRDIMRASGESGVHPLAMLGMQGPTYSPVNYVGSADTSMGDAVSRAGQGISRSLEATRTQGERFAHASRLDGLVMERAGLENDLLRMRIASEMASMKQNANPAMPIGGRWMLPGQGDAVSTTGNVTNEPMKRIGPGANPTAEPGAVTDVGFSRTPTGWAPTRSKDLQDRAEDDAIGSVTWNVRNRLLPSLGIDYNGPFPAPAGKRWIYHTGRQEYQLIDATRREGWDPSAPYRKRYGGPQ